MLKNVAGGLFDARSEPGVKSARASATTVSSAANEGDGAQILVERTSPAIDANERSCRNFRRGLMNDVLISGNVSRRLCVVPRPPVIGTETAACAAYAELKWLKG